MRIKDYLTFFIGLALGFCLYEVIIYVVDPYQVNWASLVASSIIKSLIATVILALYFLWKGKRTSKPTNST